LPPPAVTVARPVEREVVEWDEYPARLQATEMVEVRARVSGYLQAIHFKDGAFVQKGDLLFTIDPRPYEAVQRGAEAEHAVAKARLALAEKKAERAVSLVKREAISQEETDIRAAEQLQAGAMVAAAAAAVETAKLEVDFTQIRSPIAGRTGRRLVTEGNLINGGTLGTLLTTIVSLDPIYAYVEADERSFLKYSRLARSGERLSSREYRNPVHLGLADEPGFPHQGHMDFVDNQLDQGTGTMVGRAVIPNPDFLLTPGMFGRLRLPGGGKFQAVLIPDPAVLADQAEKFVWVLDVEDRAQYRRVHTGGMYEGLRIIRDGLKPGDRVIVAGVQRVRPGTHVVPEEAPAASVVPGAPSPGAPTKE
jgi:RND family efflux transporter MFP subunit